MTCSTSTSTSKLSLNVCLKRAAIVMSLSALAACSSTPTSDSSSTSNGSNARTTNASPFAIAKTNYYEQAKLDPVMLLNRLSWGVNSSSLNQMNAVGMDAYLRQQLQARGSSLPPAVQEQIAQLTISQKPFDQLMLELEAQRKAAAEVKGTDDTLRKAYQQELTRLAREAATRSLLRYTYSSNQLLEQMDWFWMNHFNVSTRKENLRAMVGDFEETAIRPYALGNFKDLLRSTLAHPAMLRYLDNEHNAANKINENYARELLELHTMGVGSGYTQNDVQELARVLTGISIRLRQDKNRKADEKLAIGSRQHSYDLIVFDAKRHDFGDKLILGTTIKGSGLAEIEQVLDLLMRQPATAKFVSKKIAMYFVSDKPSEALISAMADRFLQTRGDIPSVLKTMFDSQEFMASLGQKFKDPMHYVVSSMRLAYEDKTIVNMGPILNWLNTLGQTPNGHLTPDGYPLNQEAWASPAQMTSRFDIAKLMARGAPNLFKPESDDGKNESLNVQARELAKPALAQNNFVKDLSKRFAMSSQEALSQSGSAQEWNAFFLATPEMMRR